MVIGGCGHKVGGYMVDKVRESLKRIDHGFLKVIPFLMVEHLNCGKRWIMIFRRKESSVITG